MTSRLAGTPSNHKMKARPITFPPRLWGLAPQPDWMFHSAGLRLAGIGKKFALPYRSAPPTRLAGCDAWTAASPFLPFEV
jgi:hypothetical protein